MGKINMNDEEIRTTIEEMKAQVKAKPENKEKTEEEIEEMMLDGFFKAYTEGKMSKEDLGALAGVMGYEFTEDFDKEEEVKPGEGQEQGAEEGVEGMTKEQLEDAREIKPGESKEEFKEKIEDVKEGEAPAPAAEEGKDAAEGEETEEDERKKASELWKMNLNK